MAERRTELVRAIEGVLGGTPGVSGAAYFGSWAQGRCDGYSDIDLLVHCDPGAASQVVDGMDAVLGVVVRARGCGRRSSSIRVTLAELQP